MKILLYASTLLSLAAIMFADTEYQTIALVLLGLACLDAILYFFYDNLPARIYSGKWARSNAMMSYLVYVCAVPASLLTAMWVGPFLTFGHGLFLIFSERELRKKGEKTPTTA